MKRRIRIMIIVNEGGLYLQAPYQSIPLVLTDGETEAMFCPWCRDLFVQATVVGLGSGDSINVIVEGSLDGIGWDNLNASELATAISSNGTTLFEKAGALPPYIKVVVDTTSMVSEDVTIALQAHIQHIA